MRGQLTLNPCRFAGALGEKRSAFSDMADDNDESQERGGCHNDVSVTAVVNKWGAPNKKRDSSSSAILARIVKRDSTLPIRTSEK